MTPLMYVRLILESEYTLFSALIGATVGNYVAGALLQATIAGVVPDAYYSGARRRARGPRPGVTPVPVPAGPRWSR